MEYPKSVSITVANWISAHLKLRLGNRIPSDIQWGIENVGKDAICLTDASHNLQCLQM